MSMPHPSTPTRRRAVPRTRALAVLVALLGLALGLCSPAPVAAAPLDAQDILAWARHAERESGTPATLLLAIARIESGFDPRAVGPAIPRLAGTPDEHALGLMQFLPSTYAGLAPVVDGLTGKALGAQGVWDPESAILAAGRYLADSGAPGDLTRALLAYNNDPAYGAAALDQQARYDREFGAGDGASGIRAAPTAGGANPEFGHPTEAAIEGEVADSPLAGHAAFLQRAAESRGLPVTVALAIIKQESGYGRAPAQGTRYNYGGLVDPARDGGAGTRRVFRDFPDVETGLDAVIANMASASYAGLTMAAYVERYLGPPSEGDAGTYLANALATVARLGGHATAASIPLPQAGTVGTPPAPGSVPAGGGTPGGRPFDGIETTLGQLKQLIGDLSSPQRYVPILLRAALTTVLLASLNFLDLLIGTIAGALGFDRLTLAFTISPRLTYAFPGVLEWWPVCRNLAAAAAIVALAGVLLQIVVGPFLGRPPEEALRLLPRLVAGTLLAGLSLAVCRGAIDLSNAFSAAFGGAIRLPTIQDLFSGTPERIVIGRFLLVCTTTVYLLLYLQLLTRTVMIAFLTILSPLAAIAWVHPLTQRWAARWAELFVTRLVATALQTLALTLAGSFIGGLRLADPGSFALILVGLIGYAGVFSVPFLVRTGESPSMVGRMVVASTLRQVVGGTQQALRRRLVPPPPNPLTQQLAVLQQTQARHGQLAVQLAQIGVGRPGPLTLPRPQGGGGSPGPRSGAGTGGQRGGLDANARTVAFGKDGLDAAVRRQIAGGGILRTPGRLQEIGTHGGQRAVGEFHRGRPGAGRTHSIFAGAGLTPRTDARPAGFSLLPGRLTAQDLAVQAGKEGLTSSTVGPNAQAQQYLALGFSIKRHQEETARAARGGATLADLLARDQAFAVDARDGDRARRLLDPARLLDTGRDGEVARAALRGAFQEATDAWHGVALPGNATARAASVTPAVAAFADTFAARYPRAGRTLASVEAATARAQQGRDEAGARRDRVLADYRDGTLDREGARDAVARAQFAYRSAGNPDATADWTPPERAALHAWAGLQLDRIDQGAAAWRRDAILDGARSGMVAPEQARDDLAAANFAAYSARHGIPGARLADRDDTVRARYRADAGRTLARQGGATSGTALTSDAPWVTDIGTPSDSTPDASGPRSTHPGHAASMAAGHHPGPLVAAQPSPAPAIDPGGDRARTWYRAGVEPRPTEVDPGPRVERGPDPPRPLPTIDRDVAPVPVPLPVDYDPVRYLGGGAPESVREPRGLPPPPPDPGGPPGARGVRGGDRVGQRPPPHDRGADRHGAVGPDLSQRPARTPPGAPGLVDAAELLAGPPLHAARTGGGGPRLLRATPRRLRRAARRPALPGGADAAPPLAERRARLHARDGPPPLPLPRRGGDLAGGGPQRPAGL